jgi:hypothetical protein
MYQIVSNFKKPAEVGRQGFHSGLNDNHLRGKGGAIDIQIELCDTTLNADTPLHGKACSKSAILIEEEVVPKMDSSLKRSAAASLLALR